MGTRIETIVAHPKGFILGGSNGYFSVYEKAGDGKEPFLLIKTLNGGEETFSSLAISSNKETLLAFTKSERLLSFPLGNIDMIEEGASDHFTEVL